MSGRKYRTAITVPPSGQVLPLSVLQNLADRSIVDRLSRSTVPFHKRANRANIVSGYDQRYEVAHASDLARQPDVHNDDYPPVGAANGNAP